jgi:type I restriction enzyme S subunit
VAAVWPTITLNDAVDLFDSQRVPLNSRQRLARQGKFPYYGAQGVIDHIDDYIFDGRYILVAEDGENLNSKKLPLALFAKGKFWVNNHAHILRGKPEIIDDTFLLACLNNADIRPFVTGAAQPKLSQGNLRLIEIPHPPLHIQQRIARIISAYDDLIENNQRRIKILESMARGLYREWFVRFRFPGHENHPRVASAMGEIPQGWNIKKLGDLIEFKKGKKPASVFESEEVGLQRHLLIDALRGGSSQEFVAPDKLISTTLEDTIMVMDGSGSSDIFIGYEGVIGSTLGRYRTQVDVGIGPFWLFLFFSSHHAEIKSKNVGSAIPHANKDFINGMEVVIGPKDVIVAFEKAVEPMFGLIRSLNNKANTLRTTRDLLLPRLLSGQIDFAAM